MADWLSLVFALIIVGCFLMLGRFVIRLGNMEREAMFDHLNLPPREIPSQHMVGVKNPFLLKLKSDDDTNGFTIKTGDLLLMKVYKSKNKSLHKFKLNFMMENLSC